MQVIALMLSLFSCTISLKLAGHQSQFDLALMSHVRGMINFNNWIERCHIQSEVPIEQQTIYIDGINVYLVDHDTFIECEYIQDYRYIVFRVYYDQNGVLDVDYIDAG